MEDLWPELGSINKLVTPDSILREQASVFSQKMNNQLEAKVVRLKEGTIEDDFGYRFYITAPSLGNYRFRLFTIGHSIVLYPVRFYLDSELMKEVFPLNKDDIYAHDESLFKDILKKIFSTTRTTKIITALISQAQSSGGSSTTPLPPALSE